MPTRYLLGHLGCLLFGLGGVLLAYEAIEQRDFVRALAGMSCWAVCMAGNEWLREHRRRRRASALDPQASEDTE